MTWSFIKDTLEFAQRHWRVLILLILPIQLVLVSLFEFSNIEVYVTESIKLLESSQDSTALKTGGLETDALETDSSLGDATQALQPELNVPDGSSFMLFGLYLMLSVMPVALVIHYVSAVFTSDSTDIAVLYTRAMPLSLMLVGYHLLVWGGLLFGFFSVYSLLSGLGVMGDAISPLVITVLMSFGIYVHYRLSLAPYFWREQEVSIIQSLKLSWHKARFSVLLLIIGKTVLYIGVLMLVSILTSILQGILPSEFDTLVRMTMNIVAGIGGVLQTVFAYRVYSYIEEKAVENH